MDGHRRSSARAASFWHALGLAIAISGCVVSTGPEGASAEPEAPVDAGPGCQQEAVLVLEDVTCPSCREVIAASLLSLEGVVAAEVSLVPPEARVVYCDELEPDDLVERVQSAGYEATSEE